MGENPLGRDVGSDHPEYVARGLSRCTTLLALLAIAPAAHADEALERGERLSQEADFEGALRALDEADLATLTRDERVRLYGTRALVRFALGDEAGARGDLERLLAMGADASLPDRAPPQLREMLEEVHLSGASPPRLRTDARIEDGRARIDARAEGGADLTESVRIVVDGEDAGPSVDRPIAAGETLAWYAEAVGPGALVLATFGTADEPNVLRVRVLETEVTNARSDEGGDDVGWWVALGGGGGALVVGAAIVAGVLLAPSGGGGTQLGGPTLEL